MIHLRQYVAGVLDDLARDPETAHVTRAWVHAEVSRELSAAQAKVDALNGGNLVTAREFREAVIVRLLEVIRPRVAGATEVVEVAGSKMHGKKKSTAEVVRLRPKDMKQ
jgi:hypothetical protein